MRCETCGHRPPSPGVFEVIHVVPRHEGGAEKFMKFLCAYCIPNRITFLGKLVVKGVF